PLRNAPARRSCGPTSQFRCPCPDRPALPSGFVKAIADADEDGPEGDAYYGVVRRRLFVASHEKMGLPYVSHSVGPMLQGANSSSPTPFNSLLVLFPDATARISS